MKNRRLLFLSGLFLIAMVSLVITDYHWERSEAISTAEEQIENALGTHRALHAYIENVQKPEFYRLKDEGHLYKEFFSPRVMSFTYIARNVQRLLQEERSKQGLPPIHFKLAAINARNPINQADQFEADLLERMNEEDLEEYRAIIERDGEKSLYVALPVRPNSHTCMRCHGEPADAPAELVEEYGDVRGFYEELGDIRAFVSISVPVSDALSDAKRRSLLFSLLSLGIFGGVFGVIAYLLSRLEKQKRTVMIQNEELTELSNTDVLTSLDNRRKFDENLMRELQVAQRYNTALGLILVDIDYFKRVNDSYGHMVGDEVLVAFASLLVDNIREVDSCARWGGEEFILLFPQTNLQGVESVAEMLHARIGEEQFPGDIRLTASFGVTEYKPDEDVRGLLIRLDRALYRAKHEGRDQVISLSADEESAPASDEQPVSDL